LLLQTTEQLQAAVVVAVEARVRGILTEVPLLPPVVAVVAGEGDQLVEPEVQLHLMVQPHKVRDPVQRVVREAYLRRVEVVQEEPMDRAKCQEVLVALVVDMVQGDRGVETPLGASVVEVPGGQVELPVPQLTEIVL